VLGNTVYLTVVPVVGIGGQATATYTEASSSLTANYDVQANSGTTFKNSTCDHGVTTANTMTCSDTGGITAASFQTTGTGPDTFTAISDPGSPVDGNDWYSSTTSYRRKFRANSTTQTYAWLTDTIMSCADTSGSGTAQSCTTLVSFTPTTGSCISYTTTTANTGTGLTINVNSLGAKSVAKWQTTTTLAAGDIAANTQVKMCYDAAGHWEADTIGNAPSGSSGVGTLYGVSYQSNSINAGVTAYGTISGLDTNLTGNIYQHSITIPVSCTAQNLFVNTGNAQSAGGTLVVGLYDYTASTLTALKATISASAAAGVYSDTSDTVTITAGHQYALQVVNNGSGTSAIIQGVGFQCK
jgi:hypothetical protein